MVESNSLTIPKKNSIIKLKYVVNCSGRYGFKSAPANMDAHNVTVDTAVIVKAEAIGIFMRLAPYARLERKVSVVSAVTSRIYCIKRKYILSPPKDMIFL